MKVYSVVFVDWDATFLVGVYRTREEAEAAISKKILEMYKVVRDEFEIEEWTI